jgi:hypothetical protein
MVDIGYILKQSFQNYRREQANDLHHLIIKLQNFCNGQFRSKIKTARNGFYIASAPF